MWAFLSDGLGIISGSMMGTTPLTVFIESAAGIEEGGRTGLAGAPSGAGGDAKALALALVHAAVNPAVSPRAQPSLSPFSFLSRSSSRPSWHPSRRTQLAPRSSSWAQSCWGTLPTSRCAAQHGRRGWGGLAAIPASSRRAPRALVPTLEVGQAPNKRAPVVWLRAAQWDDVGEATPAFLTIILMPFTYSGTRVYLHSGLLPVPARWSRPPCLAARTPPPLPQSRMA